MYKLNKLNICYENTDFQDVIDKRINFPEPFPSADTVQAAFVESPQGSRRVQSTNCKYLVDGDKLCTECKNSVGLLFSIGCTKQKVVDFFWYQSKTNFRVAKCQS